MYIRLSIFIPQFCALFPNTLYQRFFAIQSRPLDCLIQSLIINHPKPSGGFHEIFVSQNDHDSPQKKANTGAYLLQCVQRLSIPPIDRGKRSKERRERDEKKEEDFAVAEKRAHESKPSPSREISIRIYNASTILIRYTSAIYRYRCVYRPATRASSLVQVQDFK